MCPNCFPNTGLASGYLIALTICALFFICAVGAMFMASRNGCLENLEETKYRMLDD
jgi:hypothetical protein